MKDQYWFTTAYFMAGFFYAALLYFFFLPIENILFQVLFSRIRVNLCNKIQTFNNTEKEAFWKHCGDDQYFFSQYFLSYQVQNHHLTYVQFVVCKCFEFAPVQKIVRW